MDPTQAEPLLSVRGIDKIYGSTQVLFGVDLDVYPGEVVALLGENGAGKSTLSGIIAGSVAPSAGSMTWKGAPYAPVTPKQAILAGIGLIHQELRLLPHLSVAENVFVGHWPMRGGRVDRTTMQRRAGEQLKRLGLGISPERKVEGLSTAAQQLVEIAKALALEARLLILDEPTAALGGEETGRLFEQIARLKSDGVGIIYISHRLEEIRQIADRIVVLRDGHKVATHERGDIPVRTIVESMVGRKIERMFPDLPEPSDKVILSVSGLAGADGAFRGVTFEVRAGEIVGIAGLVGAGRTELVRAIAGAERIDDGTLTLNDQPYLPRQPHEAIQRGLVMVPEDRKLQGVILNHKISDNIIYANYPAVSRRGWMSWRTAGAFVDEAVQRLRVKGRPEQYVAEMSGGNQQRVVLAKWLAQHPRLVVLDEPTRGIDVGARSSIYDIIVELAASGVAVIVVSSDLEEVLGISHRIVVLSDGRQTGILDRSEANDVSVMELATA
jgi:ribose transport system ATP-binding protein